MLTLGILFGDTVDIVKVPKYQNMATAGPLRMLDVLDRQFKEAVPGDEPRAAELNAAKMVVNTLLPYDYHRGSPEQKLWFACQCVIRVVRSGWVLPKDEEQRAFIQGAYDCGINMDGITLPDTQGWIKAIEAFPEKARAAGLFKN